MMARQFSMSKSRDMNNICFKNNRESLYKNNEIRIEMKKAT